MWENMYMKKDEYDEAVGRLMVLGSVSLASQPKTFNEHLFLGAYNILTLSKLLNQLGFSSTYMVVNTGSIYTENSSLIEFCKEYQIPLKVYHNYMSEKIEL